jgi:hypothetical protein
MPCSYIYLSLSLSEEVTLYPHHVASPQA